MTNDEVVRFIEQFRGLCERGVSRPSSNGEDVTPENATIAQLLCEEARYRWNAIVEEEDVLIDDISCVILELKTEGYTADTKPGKVLVPAPTKIPEISITAAGASKSIDGSAPPPPHLLSTLSSPSVAH
jgi:hypothetical protein